MAKNPDPTVPRTAYKPQRRYRESTASSYTQISSSLIYKGRIPTGTRRRR